MPDSDSDSVIVPSHELSDSPAASPSVGCKTPHVAGTAMPGRRAVRATGLGREQHVRRIGIDVADARDLEVTGVLPRAIGVAIATAHLIEIPRIDVGEASVEVARGPDAVDAQLLVVVRVQRERRAVDVGAIALCVDLVDPRANVVGRRGRMRVVRARLEVEEHRDVLVRIPAELLHVGRSGLRVGLALRGRESIGAADRGFLLPDVDWRELPPGRMADRGDAGLAVKPEPPSHGPPMYTPRYFTP